MERLAVISFVVSAALACTNTPSTTETETDTGDSDETSGWTQPMPEGCRRVDGETPGHEWTLRCGGESSEQLTGIAHDPAGNFIAGLKFASSYSESSVFGEFEIYPDGGDIVLVGFDPEGTPQWVRHFDVPGKQTLHTFRSCRDGAVALINAEEGYADLGGGLIAEPGVLVVFDSQGGVVWSRSGDYVETRVIDVHCDATGALAMTGTTQGVDLGGGQLEPQTEYTGFVARFSPSGGHLWSLLFNSTDPSNAGFAVSHTPTGSIVVGGYFLVDIDLGSDRWSQTGATRWSPSSPRTASWCGPGSSAARAARSSKIWPSTRRARSRSAGASRARSRSATS